MPPAPDRFFVLGRREPGRTEGRADIDDLEPDHNPNGEQEANICAMIFPVGRTRTCLVSFCEAKGHGRFTVEVTAESMFEAAVRALHIFRREPWSMDAAYTTGYLEVEVKAPAVQYKVLVDDLERWLTAPGGSPRETALRERLKELLG